MFIRPASDIHNEFGMFTVPPMDSDARGILILSGDIGVGKTISTLEPFFDKVSEQFADVLFIPGNHEYYYGSLVTMPAKLEALSRRYMNVHYMDRRMMKIGGIRFVGATLWTDYNSGNPVVIQQCREAMNDFKQIRTGTKAEPYVRRSKPLDFMALNTLDRLFIEQELKAAKEAGERAVVFTHHGPSFLSRPDWERQSPVDYAYYNTGLEDLILDFGPEVWIHGHSHYPVDYMLGDTRIVSNPRGYHGHETSLFNDALAIEL